MSIIGHKDVIARLCQWFGAMRTHLNEDLVVILIGPPGIGKTMLVRQMCAERNVRLHDVDPDNFDRSLLNMCDPMQCVLRKSLATPERRVLLIDPIESFCLSRVTRQKLQHLLKTTRTPLFCIGNQISLENQALTLHMKALPVPDVLTGLRRVWSHSEEELLKIARLARGDLRFALLTASVWCPGCVAKDEVQTNIKHTVNMILQSSCSIASLEKSYNDRLVAGLHTNYLRKNYALDQVVSIADGFAVASLFMSAHKRSISSDYSSVVITQTAFLLSKKS